MSDDLRTCTHCGKTLPASEFYTCKPNQCKACVREANYRWRDENAEQVRATKARYNDRVRGKPRRRRVVVPPVPVATQPIPSLDIGRKYEIIDTATGGAYVGNAKPDIYRGPCVAKWGRNWGIATSTGIRCFTEATLIGLQIREVA